MYFAGFFRKIESARRRQYAEIDSTACRLMLMSNFPAYGVVYRARETSSSRIVALKQIRIPHNERQDGIPITALREISILRSLKHPNVINVFDVTAGEPMDEIYMVMEYAEQVGTP